MKILEIIPQLSQGGAERFTGDLCNELEKRHDIPLVVVPNIARTVFFAKEITPEVKVICMDNPSGIYFKLLLQLRRHICQENPLDLTTQL